MEWFQERFGERFDEGRTRTLLRSVATKYDDLPNQPSEDITAE
jgi:hypothetical protein